MSPAFAKISLTAKLTAYMRQFTDIPFARDVAELIDARTAFQNLLRDQHLKPDDLTWYAPILEARYKSISEMIRRSGARQILELASGFTFRGLAMASDPGLNYVETDLEDVTVEKLALILEISGRHHLPARANLRTLAANALDPGNLAVATENFQAGQHVAIVHEGLLQYLTSTETEIVARNIHDLLEKFGGVWITPDFSLKADAADLSDPQRQFRQIVASATDRTMYNNAFDNSEHMNAYFGRLGFQVEVFNQLYLAPNIVSSDRLRPGQLDEMKPRLRLWVLERKNEA
jgi:O-methyltransferase involved in polyketide biosynthesis